MVKLVISDWFTRALVCINKLKNTYREQPTNTQLLTAVPGCTG